MSKICIFAGTTEGRRLAEYLSGQDIEVTVSVATDYGKDLIKPAKNLNILSGRMLKEQMEELFAKEHFDLVIDATHPYAAHITGTIRAACERYGSEYLRVIRDKALATAETDILHVVDSADEAAAFLDRVSGNILLTTGSKELSTYSSIRDYSERVYARILPLEASLQLAAESGLKASHIIAMQGPFSRELNIAMLKSTNAKWLLTKEGGDVGGLSAKLEAARELGVGVVLIGRPIEEVGLSLKDTIRRLNERFSLNTKTKVTIAGIGTGSEDSLTGQVHASIAAADCLIGAKRMLAAFAHLGCDTYDAVAPEKIAAFINQHPEYLSVVVLMSGDTGFFSGTKKLLPKLKEYETEVLPGISSLSYFCSRLQIDYEDIKAVSLHGRDRDIAHDLHSYGRVFTLLGGEKGVNDLCDRLIAADLAGAKLTIGERLGYPDERISKGTPESIKDGSYDSLSVALIEDDSTIKNENVNAIFTPGLPDEAFERGEGEKGLIPMTKSEVRSVCLSKLQLTKDACCWDIGAGTGSVSVEMALLAADGRVYSIEKNKAAFALLARNKERFALSNMIIVEGMAPEVCEALPTPSHVFIGGSTGNLKDIIRMLLERNPKVRIVAAAVTLETIAELTSYMKEFDFTRTEVVSLQVARERKAGSYHLMTGQNPVYIFTIQL